MTAEARAARTILAAVCGYEFVALTTHRTPTVSAWVWRACGCRHGRKVSMFAWALVVAWGTEHFFHNAR